MNYRLWGWPPLILCAFILAVPIPFVEAEIPRAEHPRPDLHRDHWLNLNGEWRFAFDPDGVGEKDRWFRPGSMNWPHTIAVPYPWESPLSGIQRVGYKGAAWYQRTVQIPAEWNRKPYRRQIYLNFGAVDWSAKVWLDDTRLGEHEGGYTPFSFSVSKILSDGKEHTLTVLAIDTTSVEQPVGKQVNWYTPTSGIWQTVYLECRNEDYAYLEEDSSPFIEDLHIQTRIDGTAGIEVKSSRKTGQLVMRILPDTPLDAAGVSETIEPGWVNYAPKDSTRCEIHVPNPKLWTPESPTLYFIQVQLWDEAFPDLKDTVHTYFGLREITKGEWAEQGHETILLNGKPFYIRGALDQAFHPDGIYTYPTDDLIKGDLEATKEFGLNNLRLHIKVDEPRFYYWADRLGVTILYDLPCFLKYTDASKHRYEKTLAEALARDKNHPSIITWVLFNETWGLEQQKMREGQEWVRAMFQKAKSLDPTRLVEDNSPCNYDHVATDINSWHFYIYDHNRAREHVENVVKETYPGSAFNYVGECRQGRESLINSEYGGVSAGMGDRDISWCLHYLTQEIRRHAKIEGYIYTELQDIEWEHNGYMNYNRSRKEYGYDAFVPVPEGQPPFSWRDLMGADFLVLDAIAGENCSDKKEESVPVSLSLYSGRPDGVYPLHWRLYEASAMQPEWAMVADGESRIQAKAYTVSAGEPIVFPVTPERLMLLYAWCTDGDGTLVARNFWVLHSLGDVPAARREGARWVIPWNPTDCRQLEGNVEKGKGENPEALSVTGAAKAVYSVALPADVDWTKVKRAVVQLELSACAGTERVDWSQLIRVPSTPQTDRDLLFPSSVEIRINGEAAGRVELPNDPADYRGILSNLFHSAPPSSYGYWQELEVPVSQLQGHDRVEVAIQTAEGTGGGIRLFGARSGRYPTAPRLVLECSE